jgi:hypothetical protein
MKDTSIPISKTIKASWTDFWKYWPFFIGVMLVFGVLSYISNYIAYTVSSKIILITVNTLISIILINISIGFVVEALHVLDGKAPEYRNILKNWNLLVNYFIVSTLYSLIVFGGFLLFFVPGVIWALKFSMSTILVIDKKMKPIKALRESARMTSGYKPSLFWFFITVIIMYLSGFLFFFVGALVSVPISWIAILYTYRYLEQRSRN